MNSTDKKQSERIVIVPSLLSADFAYLERDIKKVEEAGCRDLHLDVMDGHFVPNITIGPVVAKAIRRVSRSFLTAHLMIEDPERYIGAFKESGMDQIIIHQEIEADFVEVLAAIKKAGMAAGVSIRPQTPVKTIVPGVELLDSILIMSVEPGFGGQEYIPGSEAKVADARQLLERHGRVIPIGVDGGINIKTAPIVARAGATRLIAGSAVFKGDVPRNIASLRESALHAVSGR
ncbi:MAG: ribulose-phosphate 3-epimerase [Candidatus Aureabacteria bacterium]|nr:ribulose-phosphate 3-epimerase [Candidatus Auribacterota bacterium]